MIVKTIVLAAGNGSRMLSGLSKALHLIGGRDMLSNVMDNSRSISQVSTKLVVDQKLHSKLSGLYHDAEFVVQEQKLGTAHAVRRALESTSLCNSDVTVVLYADSPFISAETVKALISVVEQNPDTGIGVLAFEPKDDNHQYGMLKIDSGNIVRDIFEHQPGTKAPKGGIANSGLMVIRSKLLSELICKISNDNVNKEYRLTDLVKIAFAHKGSNTRYIMRDHHEAMGVNTQNDLVLAEHYFQNMFRNKLLNSGVIMPSPSTVYYSFDTLIEPGATIHPNVYIGTGVQIGTESVVWPFSFISQSTIGRNSHIGPFAYLRNNNIIEERNVISGFTEIKNSHLKCGAKAKHFAYLGNSYVGSNTNIGAGTVVCNYDGNDKYRTLIGNNCFIGANNSLVSPLNIGDGCYTAAGSCISEDIPKDHRSFARNRQINRRKQSNPKKI